MTDYTELVKLLRRMADNAAPIGRMTVRKQTEIDAADAIEHLSTQVALYESVNERMEAERDEDGGTWGA